LAQPRWRSIYWRNTKFRLGEIPMSAGHPFPLVPQTSPDQDTIEAQSTNLTSQFQVAAAAADALTGGGGGLTAIVTGAVAPISGTVFFTGAGVDASTLATPVAGDPALGGNDGLEISITDTSGKAHTVTTAANKINGNKHILTFDGTIGARIDLKAFNGVWYTDPARTSHIAIT
jgi:hypothetical protein